jgi:hypothetical protein
MNTKAARQRGEEAGNRAVARTEHELPDWSDQVMSYIRLYARVMWRRANHYPWTAEEFRNWAEGKGLPPPADARSYGPLIAKAIRDNIIYKWGYAPTISSNGSVRAAYRRAI